MATFVASGQLWAKILPPLASFWQFLTTFCRYGQFLGTLSDDHGQITPSVANFGPNFASGDQSSAKFCLHRSVFGQRLASGNQFLDCDGQFLVTTWRPPVSESGLRPSQLSPSISPLKGTMLLGAKDVDNCEDNWTYFPTGMSIQQANSVPVLR